MSANNRVVWSEGLFLRPQHFQQQDRYFERYVDTRCKGLISHGSGFIDVEYERDLLSIGRFGLRRASGVFPDGTPFRIPDDDPLPQPLEVDAQVRDQLVYLAVPLPRANDVDIHRDASADGRARHYVSQWQARDATSQSGESALLEVGPLRTRMLLASEATDAYSCLPLAHIAECRADQRVLLDDLFIPTVLQCRAASRLASFATELHGLFRQRGDLLGGRVAATGRGGAAEFAEFLLLQLINRYEPLLAHYAESDTVHPEQFYQLCVTAAGELATFTAPSNRAPALPRYRHDRLRESFEPVMTFLRASLAKDFIQIAVPIPIEPRKFGVSVAVVQDGTLFEQAVFVLAARANVASEELRRSFPAQLKVGSVERLPELMRLGLPGVPLSPMPAVPRQIPFHAGFVYFEFDRSHELWDQVKKSGGIAFQVAGNFPGLTLELWAIRGSYESSHG